MLVIHSSLMILIGVLPFSNMSFAQQPRSLLTIDFSLDSKGDREFGHKVIRYSLTEEGEEIDLRDVYDWAHQASHRRELSKDVVANITNLVRGLSHIEEKNIPKDWLVIVTFHDGNNVRVSEYHRKKLPRGLKEVLELLGGIRFELRDTIGFSAAGT